MKNKPYFFVIPIILLGTLGSCICYTKTSQTGLSLMGAAGTILIAAYVYLELYDYQQRLQELLHLQEASIGALVELAQMRDEEVTGRHLNRLPFYAQVLAEDLGLNPEFKENIVKTIALHDIGKVAVPDSILKKPGPLNREEWIRIRRHPLAGAAVLDAISEELDGSNRQVAEYLATAQEIALNHHEKWDGSGYPQGLEGRAIPLSARVAAVCDVYDSLRSTRPYKRGFSHEEAVEIIRSGRGTHFDPRLIDSFERLAGRFEAIWEKHGEQTR
ncbi:MAG: HD domain-containing protein [Firmicutes bacterium]|nr:HD domain-containing protein [Bacillota bacterium]